jgi:T5SS/PEP-CTERM-associated repeat protein
MHQVPRGSLIAGILIAFVLSSQPIHAQYTADFQTNIISGVTNDWSGGYGEYDVGLFYSDDVLLIQNSGVLIDKIGSVGFDSSCDRNSALVTGPGSVWSNSTDLFIGFWGSNNRLAISVGGQVIDSNGYVGMYNGGEDGRTDHGASNSVTVASGEMWRNNELCIGYHGSSNSVVVDGGSVFSTNLTVGFESPTCDNLLRLDSGSVIVTNAAHNATLEVRYGRLMVNGGTLQVDRFIMTSASAQFARTGGTLAYGVAVLDPNRDDDGDGILNGWEQSHGLDPLNAADANVDSDGDGFTNLEEYLAGTDPTNCVSSFRITSLVGTDHDVLITWTTGIGKTNALQAAAGDGDYYTNSFADIFTVTNTVGSVTNYLDPGAAGAISASRFYRVRLVP